MRRGVLGVRPRGRSDLASWYAAALADQASSGLSAAAYAARLGVSSATFYAWRRRLGVGGRGITPGRTNAKLVEVTVAPPPGDRNGRLIVRLHDDRRSIEVHDGFDGEELRRLIEVLETC